MKDQENQAIIIVDLGFGDAGKGSITDYLSRELPVHTVIRYNGGTQAAHNVITPDGRHHTFRQFGSGTLVEGVRTHLSRFMLVDPLSLFKEERELVGIGITDAFSRTTVDRLAVITTPFHQAVNRLKEIARDNNRHGSCGLGIGETMSDFLTYKDRVLLAADFTEPVDLIKKLTFLRELQLDKIADIRSDLPGTDQTRKELQLLDDRGAVRYCADLYEYFATQAKIVDSDYTRRVLNRPGTVLFEGAQGVLLDQAYGFFPHTTWTDTTAANAITLLSESDYRDQKTKLGVIRTYSTRHGAGPFVTEDAGLTKRIPEIHNASNAWQGDWRNGYLDLVLTRYAMEATGGVDGLVVTHLDRLKDISDWKAATAYKYKEGVTPSDFFETRDGDIFGIKVQALPVSIEHQAELNQLLTLVTPVYSPVRPMQDEKAVLQFIEESLEVPVALTSSGMSASDKKFTNPSKYYERVA